MDQVSSNAAPQSGPDDAPVAAAAQPRNTCNGKRKHAVDADDHATSTSTIQNGDDTNSRDPMHNPDILRLIFLHLGSSLADVNRASAVCRGWRDIILQNSDIWTMLLVSRYPNLRLLSGRGIRGTRDKYLERLCLRRRSDRSVRGNNSGNFLPPPELQLRTPGDTLLERWNKSSDLSIVFLVDVWRGSTRILSHGWRVGPDDYAEHEQYCLSTNQYPELGDVRNVVAELSVEKRAAGGGEGAEVLAELTELEEIMGSRGCSLREDGESYCGIYVSVAYRVEGSNVPPHDPIFLLSEHGSLNFNPDNFEFEYRTDCAEEWLNGPPHDYDWESRRQLMRRCKNWGERTKLQFARYGRVPLPFDPVLWLHISPFEFGNEDFALNYPFQDDNKEAFSYRFELQFAKAEDYQVDFKLNVLPTLLSMWNDATRKFIYQV